jgi:penicillin-binding protein 2
VIGAGLEIRGEARRRDLRPRLAAYAGLIGAVFLAIVGRLWMLQIVHGEEYAAEAEANHLKQREIPAPRGSIYTADEHRIAEVRASFDLVVVPRDVSPLPDPVVGGELASSALGGPATAAPEADEPATRADIGTLARRLEPLLDGVTQAEILEHYTEARRHNPYRNAVLASDLSREALERVLAARPRLPGVSIVTRHRRSYPDGPLFGHIVGYRREVRKDELAALRERFAGSNRGEDYYEAGDRIGKYGLEKAYESWLRGDDGAFWVQVDVHGRELGRSAAPDVPGGEYFRSIAHFLDRAVIPEVPGHDLHLTVRRDLQQRAVELLGEESGSVVMLEVHTGRVLAMANTPSFDPDLFSRPIPPAVWQALVDDPSRPLSDKALQGVYPPGSTYKLVIAAAVLGTHTWTPETTIRCPGWTRVGNRRFRCWKSGGHGTVDLRAALKGSCNVYFYRAGLAMGIDTVARYADMFGLGRATGIGINGERPGLNPTTEWKRKRFLDRPSAGRWTAGDTASAVIGQGYTGVTPIQLARMTATMANGGTLYRPILVDRVVAPDGRVVLRSEPEVLGHVDLSPEHFDVVREGLWRVVNEPGGTAYRHRIKGLEYAGKTGTAQVVRLGASTSGKFGHHKWFVGFAPYENPEVAICVLVEHGKTRGVHGTPIAAAMFREYFKDRLPPVAEEGG